MTDRDYWQDRRVDRIAGELHEQHQTADAATTDVLGSLTKRLASAERELARQNLAITALTESLIERGVLDGEQLGALFDRKLRTLEAEALLVPCARCKTKVERSITMMTGSGPMCPTCYQAVNADE